MRLPRPGRVFGFHRKMDGVKWILLAALLLAARARAQEAPGADGQILDTDVEKAIDTGVENLLQAVEGPAGWMPDKKFGTGYAALAVYALVKSDVSYLHSTVQKGIGVMESYSFEKVYSVSLYVMAYDAMIEQIDTDARLGESKLSGDRAKFLERMRAGVEWLIDARLRGRGAWNYEAVPRGENPKTHRYDHSNTQFAVLALGVAAERKLKIPAEIWEEIADHFIADQEAEGKEVAARPLFRAPPAGAEKGKDGAARKGRELAPSPSGKTVVHRGGIFEGEKLLVRARGWKYTPDEFQLPGAQARRRQFSMVCAGLSSLLLAQRNLPPTSLGGGRGEKLLTALRDGYGWLCDALDGNRRPGLDYYAFYSLEKVGDIGEVVAFANFRWYEECARAIILSQRGDGSWRDPYKDDEAATRAATGLALLFLDRATDLGARSRPLVQITRAGGAQKAAAPDRQAWIYLPSIKAEVPVARLFRLLRYRPGKQVMKLAEEAVKVCDPERLSMVVRPLAATARLSPYPQSQALAQKLLEQAAGFPAEDPKSYEEWAACWDEVIRIGKAADPTEAEKLRELLGTAKGTPLQAKVLWALGRVGDRESLGKLIELLDDPDPAIREAAYSSLTVISKQSLPFHPRANDRTREEEARAWRIWYEAEKSKAQEKKE